MVRNTQRTDVKDEKKIVSVQLQKRVGLGRMAALSFSLHTITFHS